MLQYAKAQVSMVQSGCQPPTEKKKQLKEKVKNECQKQETGLRKKRGILYYDRCVPPPHYFSIYKIHSTIFLLKEKRKQMRETSLEFFTVSEYTTRRPARFRLANMYNDDDESTTCFGSLLLLPLRKNKRRGKKKKKKNW